VGGLPPAPDEAVVFIGKTPPECSYFSYCNYIALRYYPRKVKPSGYSQPGRLPEQPGHRQRGHTRRAEGDAFEQYTVIISTADKGIDQRVRDALASAGYSMDIVNTAVIPSGLVKMGLDADDDTSPSSTAWLSSRTSRRERTTWAAPRAPCSALPLMRTPNSIPTRCPSRG